MAIEQLKKIDQNNLFYFKDNEELPNNISENQNTYTFNVPSLEQMEQNNTAANMNPSSNNASDTTTHKFEF